MSHAIIWAHDIAPGHEAAFRAVYGPNSDWAQLFACAPGFIGVELFSNGVRYATIDRRDSAAAFDAFQAEYGETYRALDAKFAHLTGAQQRIGAFASAA